MRAESLRQSAHDLVMRSRASPVAYCRGKFSPLCADFLIQGLSTVEFFNLIVGTGLTAQEKQDLLVFLRAL